uniref:Putative secreted protein n=1 Tax=Anopheles marajoara TaxID=58244 RepID=A0A2M4CBC0_9DIPT
MGYTLFPALLCLSPCRRSCSPEAVWLRLIAKEHYYRCRARTPSVTCFCVCANSSAPTKRAVVPCHLPSSSFHRDKSLPILT